MANIYAKAKDIGIGVTLESDIGTPANPCDYVNIGDHVYIGEGCRISSPSISIGDYTKIHRNSLLYGRNPVRIGHNCWFGEGTIIDAEGLTSIGDNVGVGAHSQLWSHIRHGDLAMGCRYYGFNRLTILNDAWLVGHCIVSPVTVGAFSVGLVGAVITRDMEPNHVYGGSPAKDLTEKLGEPYSFPSIDQRYLYIEAKMQEFAKRVDTMNHRLWWEKPQPLELKLVEAWEPDEPGVSQFNVVTREYTKKRTTFEIAFMKFLLPEVKFTPKRP